MPDDPYVLVVPNKQETLTDREHLVNYRTIESVVNRPPMYAVSAPGAPTPLVMAVTGTLYPFPTLTAKVDQFKLMPSNYFQVRTAGIYDVFAHVSWDFLAGGLSVMLAAQFSTDLGATWLTILQDSRVQDNVATTVALYFSYSLVGVQLKPPWRVRMVAGFGSHAGPVTVFPNEFLVRRTSFLPRATAGSV